jgi:hypothetical protein
METGFPLRAALATVGFVGLAPVDHLVSAPSEMDLDVLGGNLNTFHVIVRG